LEIHQYALARYNPDGSPDTMFGQGGNRTVALGAGSHEATDMAVLPGGQILLAGTQSLDKHALLLTRLNADGSPDAKFAAGGNASVTCDLGSTSSFGTGVRVQSDGRIVMAGYAWGNGSSDVGLARFVGEGLTAGPPTMTAVVVNGGAAQRSQVRTLTVAFDRPVTLGSGAFTLSLLNTGAAPTDASSALRAATSPDGGRTWVIPVGAPSGSTGTADRLADGVYQFSVDPTKVRSNGIAMTTAPTFRFHELFGDTNGSRSVNAADYTAFRNAFGKSLGQGGYDAALDFDGNGSINALDFSQFRSRFGKSISY
jgi:uncharacterized delta-60 repeat protein